MTVLCGVCNSKSSLHDLWQSVLSCTYVCVLVLYFTPQVTFEEKVCNFIIIEQPIKKVIQTVPNIENISVNENLLNSLKETRQISH